LVCEFINLPERANACSFCRLLARTALPYGYFSGVTPLSAYQGDWLGIGFVDGNIWTMKYSDDRGLMLLRKIESSGRLPLSPRFWSSIGGIYSGDGVDAPVPYFRDWMAPGFRRVVGGLLSWHFVEQSLDICLKDHDECGRLGADANFALPADFRVIDVKKRCLVQMPPSCQFFALSYVWGHEPDPTKLFTTMLNLKALEEDGGLAAQSMPATVEAAMEVCRKLEQPYLWVDRFCIVQDNHGHKAQQVAAMAAIYSLARLVIIVTDGNSDSGIAGVSRERLQIEGLDRIAGLDFITQLPSLEEVEVGCIWSTRGWTYQEAILAERKLFLTESQAFFECRKHCIGEDGSRCGLRTLVSPTRPEFGVLVEAFYGHLDRYRIRSLTNASDIYDAIDGVANALYGGPGSLWRGLPRRDIDRALLWCIEWSKSAPRSVSRIAVSNPASHGTRPSWSWSATRKQIRLLNVLTIFENFGYCETLVAWAGIYEGVDGLGRRAVESVETVSGGKPLSQFDKGQDKCGCPSEMSDGQVKQLIYLVVAWSHGCINAPYPFAKLENTTFPALRSQIKSRWACRHDYWLEAFGGIVHLTSLDHTHTAVPCSPDIIFTWAQSAFFPLQGFSTSQMRDGYICIADEADKPAGLLIFQDNELDLKPNIGRRLKFEFIALSMSTVDSTVSYDMGYCRMGPRIENPWPRSPGRERRLDTPIPPHLTVCDGEGERLFPLPVVNVMLIKRIGENHARRAGVGWIYLTSWVSAGPEFKMIYLE
jgi:hypothetical protein